VTTRTYLAFDLGAASGRAVLGSFDGEALSMTELSRFANGPLSVLGHLHWNVFRLFEEMKKALALCAARGGTAPASLAVDTWGVDFGLLAGDGSILGLPYSYRDGRTQGAMESFFNLVPRETVYRLTGIQFLPFNTLFQLHAMERSGSSLLEAAEDLLFMPDLFNYLFTGEKGTERTFASTSQLFDIQAEEWSGTLFEALGVPRDVMQAIVPPGSAVGTLLPSICAETGLEPLPVMAVASHDTASAVAAVPAEGDGWAYLSSGTWSLLGVERPSPILTVDAREAGFTNEGGLGGTVRLLRNISGLWLLQECRRVWARERAFTFEELTAAAREATPFRTLVDPDRPELLNPPKMTEAICEVCRNTHQKEPEEPAQFTRAILESLALKYRYVLDQLQALSARPIERLHVIGGGVRNELLCQFTADATGLSVIAGPVEATAAGNIMVQALACGDVGSREEIRAAIRRSFELVRYEPQRRAEWEAAYERFREVVR